MDPKQQPLPTQPNSPQPADRLSEQELRPGETVQLPPPKRLVGMPLQPGPQSNPETTLAPVATPVIQKNPKLDLTPRNIPNSRFANLTEKQKKAMEKLKKMRSHKHWHNAKILVVTVLVFVLLFNSQWFISQFIYLFTRPTTTQTQPQQPNQTEPPKPGESSKPAEAQVVGPENLLIIPKINVQAPLIFIDTIDENEVLIALRDGVVHYAGTANPGEPGNSVFFGHSSNDWWEPGGYKFVFVLLEKLTVGDTYEIHYNSRKYVYQVTETKVVDPNDLSVLNQTILPSSTLITCTPPGTSWKRFVVVAKQIEPAPIASTTQPQGSQQNQGSQASATLPSAPPSLWEQVVNFFNSLFGGGGQADKNSQQNPVQTQRLPEVN